VDAIQFLIPSLFLITVLFILGGLLVKEGAISWLKNK
jgi:hypothetical protein